MIGDVHTSMQLISRRWWVIRNDLEQDNSWVLLPRCALQEDSDSKNDDNSSCGMTQCISESRVAYSWMPLRWCGFGCGEGK